MATLSDLIFLSAIGILTVMWVVWMIRRSRKGRLPLPPGPAGLPLIGNLLSMEPELHRYFAKLAETYGPIFKLRLGRKILVVFTSPSMAKEVLKDQDTVFANHEVLASATTMTYGRSDIVWSNYGPVWRMLRKVCVQDLLNTASIDAGRGARRQQLYVMLSNIYSSAGNPMDVSVEITQTIFNSMTSMMWGGTVKGENKDKVAEEFRQVMGEAVEIMLQPNVSDLYPTLARFDLQGVQRKLGRFVSWFDGIFNTILEQRMKAGSNNKDNKDFLDILLKIQKEADPKMPLTMTQVKAILLDMVAAGTDTTSTTLEWAMAEMMLKPETIKKAQVELDAVVGRDAILQDDQASKLVYLDAVIKEVLRLHPPNPFLIPHTPSETCVVNGYTVPKGAGIYVNTWAIQRDPAVWDRPNEFDPERFLNSSEKWDYRGTDFRYLPFGSGRRMCPGVPLVQKSLPYILGSLLHSFDWKLPEGVKLDLDDKFGQILKKSKPVILIPTPRLSNPELYAQFLKD